jgi:amidase
MTGRPLPQQSAVDLARRIRAREVSSEDVLEACLERIAEVDGRVTAFVDLLRDRARDEARAADSRLRKRGATLGPFHGVPIAVKDLNLAKGSFSRFGSRAFERLFVPFDDPVVARLRRAGFVIVGKTATSELGSLPVTEPDIHPPTRNPWDLGVTPGGSSGGAGAAVAAGMVPIAQGGDAAGSIRIPSSFCRLFGIKPSRGRVENPFTHEDEHIIWTCGPLARTVGDAAAVLDVMAGITVGQPHRAPPPPRPFAELAEQAPRGLRIAVAVHSNHVQTEPEIAAAVERVASLLSGLGHRIERRSLDLPEGIIDEFLPVWQATAATAPVHDWSLTQPVTRWLGEQGMHVQAERVVRIVQKLGALVLEQFGDVDAWITPTVAVAPPRIGAWSGLAPPDVFREAIKLGVFTAPFNISGQPAASVPAGRSSLGHPIGVQIAGRPLADGLVLALAREIERHAPWDDGVVPL